MDIITIVFIALGLAMDCLAVSIASALTIKSVRITEALKMAAFFGLFQAFMLSIGWLAGFELTAFISGVDHWIAFGLLSLIGLKMIYKSVKTESGEKGDAPLKLYALLILSVATSIDSLAAGLSLAFLEASIVTPMIVIGMVTFLLSFLGAFAGGRFGHLFGSKVEIIGGIILIGIGIKVLAEHLV